MSILTSIFNAGVHLFWQNPLAQLIGLLAVVIGVSAFLQKDDQKLRLFLTVFTLLMSIHFAMLGSWSGAIAAFIGCLRNYISLYTRSLNVVVAFVFATLALTIPFISELIHIMPIIGGVLGTWAVFREKGIRMRALIFLGTVCWLAHNVATASIGGTIIESIFLVVNSATILKLLKEKQ